VSSQGVFVPASAVYGPGARAPVAGEPRRPSYPRDGQPPMLHGAHGQPLGPLPARDPQNFGPPVGYPLHLYQNGAGPRLQNGTSYDYHCQPPAPHQEESVSRKKRPSLDDDTHSKNAHALPASYNGSNSNSNSQTQPRNVSPQPSHKYDSPRSLPLRTDGPTPPPGQPNSAGSGSVSVRSGMSVHEMLG